MKKLSAAIFAVASCVTIAHAQAGQPAQGVSATAVYTLDQAVRDAGGAAPAAEAAEASIAATRAAQAVAALRPNPQVQGQIENVVGSGPYSGLQGAETTIGVAIPIELGGKRGARIGVAEAQFSRAVVQAAIARADVRLQVTSLYIEAVAANRRLSAAGDQARIAGDASRAADVRVQAGRASPIEQQRANVARINAEANVERLTRLANAARTNLSRRLGGPVVLPLDASFLDQLPSTSYGPASPVKITGTLAYAASEADVAIADAGVRLARSNRIPDLNVGPALRRFEATNDTAAVFSVSIPMPLFNNGRAAVAQASAERSRADAQRRITAQDVAQAITDAGVEAENAATTARATSGPALAAAQEAARIARIGYREGKFGQLELLDAERTLAETRVAAIDALANYHNARARLERLTAPAPIAETNQ